MEVIFGVSGLRGVVGEGLTPELISRYVYSFSKEIPKGEVVIGNDSRASCEMVKHAVVSSLTASGFDVVDIGVAPTPTVQFVTKEKNASGGISITASHNPEQWNGLKFIEGNGIFFNQDKIDSIKKNLQDNNFNDTSFEKCGKVIEDPLSKELHIEKVLEKIRFDCADKASITVAVDACNGAGSEVVPRFIERLGFKVERINCDLKAPFPRNPEPLKENLREFSLFIENNKEIDIGFALDGDADRVAIIDENGRYIGEENTIVLASKFFLEYLNPENKKVVTNLSTTRALEDVVSSLCGTVLRSKVGEINVVEKMIKTNALIGGEGNGGVIVSDIQYARDCLSAISLVLLGISKIKKPLSLIVSEIPSYYMVKYKIIISKEKYEKNLIYLKEFFKGNPYTEIDGLKFELCDSWVHIRPSNTEPIVRIIAEAKSLKKVNRLIEETKILMNAPC